MTTATQVPATQPSTDLIVHKSFTYDNNGVRTIYRGGGAWNPETDSEFIDRFKTGHKADMCDLKRACQLHPLLVEYTSQGKDYETAIEGICLGVPYREIFKNTGFGSWATFRSMTEFMCPGLKALFDLSLVLREDHRLEEAEEALRHRAIKGVQEPIYTPTGKLAGHRTKFSDKLLEVHLKALAPDKYSDKHQHDVKGLVLSVSMGLRD